MQRGALTVSLLARQSGLGQPHLSNFLGGKRKLSLDALDRVLAAMHLAIADLLPSTGVVHDGDSFDETGEVPVISQASAAFMPYIRASAAYSVVIPPRGLLKALRPRTMGARRAWQRFVAVKVPAEDVDAMHPVLQLESVALIDRHYNSLIPYRDDRPNLYAVRRGAHLTLRYVDFVADRLVLRPHNLSFPVELVELEPGETPNDLLAGRVAMTLNEP